MKIILKKDILLLKKQICFVVFFDIIMIGYLSYRMEYAKVLGSCLNFALTSLITILLLKSSISINEAKYPKALSLICSTPCERKEIVKEKYMLDYIVFALFFVIYLAEAVILKTVQLPPAWFFMLTFLLICCYHSIVIPVEIKLGYEKSKYVTTICIFVIPFLTPVIINHIDINKLYTMNVFEVSVALKCFIIFIISAVIDLCSYLIAKRIFIDKEL